MGYQNINNCPAIGTNIPEPEKDPVKNAFKGAEIIFGHLSQIMCHMRGMMESTAGCYSSLKALGQTPQLGALPSPFNAQTVPPIQESSVCTPQQAVPPCTPDVKPEEYPVGQRPEDEKKRQEEEAKKKADTEKVQDKAQKGTPVDVLRKEKSKKKKKEKKAITLPAQKSKAKEHEASPEKLTEAEDEIKDLLESPVDSASKSKGQKDRLHAIRVGRDILNKLVKCQEASGKKLARINLAIISCLLRATGPLTAQEIAAQTGYSEDSMKFSIWKLNKVMEKSGYKVQGGKREGGWTLTGSITR